jgi:serine/threonine-protein kinase
MRRRELRPQAMSVMMSTTDRVLNYEVITPLGAGGMAELFLARRRGVGGFSRLVTLKLVHKHLVEDEAMVERFLEEARISAHIAHPNVVHVEEVGRCGDNYFIAMEYVHGVSLAELLQRVLERGLRLRPTLCVWLAAQIAEALHATHEARGENGQRLDIVHHDVSPQNVLIAHTGHVKLIDFGIAQCRTQARDTGGAQLLGKLRYMSPEQLRREPADRKSDVYALGVMLWEMLSGHGLFRCHGSDDERDWATRRLPPPPSRYAPHCMPWLDEVVLKAIAYDPAQRYASALELRSALLDADPSAVRLDAPIVAGLLRALLGDELDRRRDGWPVDLAKEIETSTDSQAQEPQSDAALDALARPLWEPQHAAHGDDDLEPTRAGVESARACWERGADALCERFSVFGELPARLRFAAVTVCGRRHRLQAAQLAEVPIAEWIREQLQTITLRQRLTALIPPVVRALQRLRVLAGRHRVAAVGCMCLVLGVALGSRVSRTEPRAPGPRAVTAPLLVSSVQTHTLLGELERLQACPDDAPGGEAVTPVPQAPIAAAPSDGARSLELQRGLARVSRSRRPAAVSGRPAASARAGKRSRHLTD